MNNVTVKPLKWRNNRADTGFGQYEIMTLRTGLHQLYSQGSYDGTFDTIKDAKKHAQRDCEARILSMIEVSE